VYVFSLLQGEDIIATYIMNDQLKAQDSFLRGQIDSAKKAIQLCKLADTTSQKMLLIANATIAEQSTLIVAQNAENKQQKKKIKALKTETKIFGISTGVFGVAAFILLILL
jgi:hypothetical protein